MTKTDISELIEAASLAQPPSPGDRPPAPRPLPVAAALAALGAGALILIGLPLIAALSTDAAGLLSGFALGDPGAILGF